MSKPISLRSRVAIACVLTSSLFITAAQASVITGGSGYITNVTDLAINGSVYDVAFIGTADSSKIAAQSLLWSNVSEFESAVSALVSALNTISSPGSSNVFATDGSAAINNDFFVARPGGNYAHIRTSAPGGWFANSLNTGNLINVVAQFTEQPTVASVPEPGTLGLVGLGALFAFSFRRRTGFV